MSNEVRFKVTGEDASGSKTIVAVRKGTEDLKKSVDSLGLAVGFDQMSQGLAKLTPGFKGAADAASDLNEAQSKSEAVFGDSADAINEWASGAAEDFGQTKRQALDAAGAFGNMFDQLGIGADQAAEMSMNITELASDFASFHNADITEVLEAQSAAFRGEYDSLQRFLPLINAATVEQKAMAMTGKENAKELTAQEKAMAVYKLMLEGAGKAAGDYDRTADGLANTQRKVNAQIEEGRVAIGQKLAPVLSEALQLFSDLPPEVQATTVAIMDLAPGVAQVGVGLAAMGPAIGKAATSLPQFIGAAARGGPVLLGLAAAIGAAVAISEVFDDGAPKWAAALDNIADPAEKLAFAYEQAAASGGKLGFEEFKLIESLKKQVEASKEAEEFTKKQADTTATAARTAGDFGQKTKDLNAELETLSEKASEAFDAMNKWKNVPTQEQLELAAAMSTVDAQIAALELSLLDGTAATKADEEAIKKQVEALTEQRDRLSASATAMDANRQAAIDMGNAKIGASGQVKDLIGSEAELIGKVNSASEALANQRSQAQALDQQLAATIQRMNEALAMGDVMGAQEQLLVQGLPANATGTRSFPGGWTLAGEDGTELIKLPAGSQIYNHQDTMRMMSEAAPSGGGAINITIGTVYAQDEAAARKAGNDMAYAYRLATNGVRG